jgi:hypothetical protein
MVFDPNFILEHGSKIILRKKSGNKIVEFSRHSDKILDNIVELWDYDSKKKNKGKSVWLILKDLPSFLNSYINSGNYEIIDEETILNKNTKK